MKFLAFMLCAVIDGVALTGSYVIGAQVSMLHGLGLAAAVAVYALYNHVTGYVEGRARRKP